MNRLPAYSLFAAVINAAGLPIYIYAPKLYVDNHGVTLAALGTMLFALRLLDVVQDPILGWISERLGRARPYRGGSCRGNPRPFHDWAIRH